MRRFGETAVGGVLAVVRSATKLCKIDGFHYDGLRYTSMQLVLLAKISCQ
jgi:hypothetical protein